MPRKRIAFVHGVPLGAGGLGAQAANALAGLAGPDVELHAIGPGAALWPRSIKTPDIHWHRTETTPSLWRNLPGVRRFQGALRFRHDAGIGQQAAALLDGIDPALCYAFTQVALEPLAWARRRNVATILESPNGHIRNFRDVYVCESRRWCDGRSYHGHPSPRMVARVVSEYALADRIRVSSRWAAESLVAGGVESSRVAVLQQPVDLRRFLPRPRAASASGPLSVLFVGTLDLRKGFVYLLRAARALGPDVSLTLVGGTVDACTRRLLEKESAGLDVRVAAGDAVEAFARAEISVLPTLEDGSPFAVAESMACGVPAVVTDCCGAREWIDHGRTGWIVPARDADALAAVLRDAHRRRGELAVMGAEARRAAEARADPAACDAALHEWLFASR